ncbi:MAG: hypothetical protein LBC07_04360 [Elusimicrobiota bacterium]|nr:hypothetical protein [Elusimicrobiota bacterium]
MVVADQGEVVISRGNSQAVDNQKNMVQAQEMIYDKKKGQVSAFGNVVVITTSGTIKSDNAVFDSTLNTVVMKTDKKRPSAYLIYDRQKGNYTADTMTFFNYQYKIILMQGNVRAKIFVEQQDK